MNFLKSTTLASTRRRLTAYWAGDKLFILLSCVDIFSAPTGKEEVGAGADAGFWVAF